MSYTVPSAESHTSEVHSNELHATLFYFDAEHGFDQGAGVLGPKNGESFAQQRDPAGATPEQLANMVSWVHNWEVCMDQGAQYAQCDELEQALRMFNSTLMLCESVPNLANASQYIFKVLGEHGNTYRRFGRYEQAKRALTKTILP